MEGVEGIVPDVVDDDLLDGDAELLQEILEEVVGHRAGRWDVLDGQGDGVGFEDPDPYGQDLLVLGVFQDDDGHLRDGVYNETLDLHLDFHALLFSLLI